MKIKKNDQIKIIAGKDKGKTGKVLRIFPEDKKIIVEGLNLMKKNMRPKREGEKGQRVEIPRKIDVSNVMLLCPKCGKETRVGHKAGVDNKIRFCKKCQAEII
jgi:large subunit ribosomal protein L24